jgi:hypothetical protein
VKKTDNDQRALLADFLRPGDEELAREQFLREVLARIVDELSKPLVTRKPST